MGAPEWTGGQSTGSQSDRCQRKLGAGGNGGAGRQARGEGGEGKGLSGARLVEVVSGDLCQLI